MKNKLLKTFILTLILSSCQKTEEVIVEPKAKIEFSQKPIWINQDCETKTIAFRLNYLHQDSIEVKLDGEVVEVSYTNKNNSANSLYGKVIIPTAIGYKSISISSLKDNIVLEEAEIVYVQQDDTLSFYNSNYILPRPIVLKELKCWDDFERNKIKGRVDYEINYQLKRTTQASGNSLQRILEIENVYLVESESKKRFSISPNVSHSKHSINYGGLESKIINMDSKTRVGIELDIEGKKIPQTLVVSQGLRGKEDGYLSYRPIYNIYGKQIIGVVKSCNQIDTLEVHPFVLPEYIQLELGCVEEK